MKNKYTYEKLQEIAIAFAADVRDLGKPATKSSFNSWFSSYEKVSRGRLLGEKK